MTIDPRTDLVGQVNRGDAEAVESLYRTYAPYLRAIVRRLLSNRLRSQFDSMDVVQSVWVHVVRQLGGPGWIVGNEDQLRALLATIVRRRLFNRARQDNSDNQEPGEQVWDNIPEVRQSRPSEMVQADELWDSMLRLCPEEHRAVLVLRRQGLLLNEIAERTGLHEGSVRRIFRRLSRELASQNQLTPDLLADE